MNQKTFFGLMNISEEDDLNASVDINAEDFEESVEENTSERDSGEVFDAIEELSASFDRSMEGIDELTASFERSTNLNESFNTSSDIMDSNSK